MRKLSAQVGRYRRLNLPCLDFPYIAQRLGHTRRSGKLQFTGAGIDDARRRGGTESRHDGKHVGAKGAGFG
jgi:hypothetical protein